MNEQVYEKYWCVFHAFAIFVKATGLLPDRR